VDRVVVCAAESEFGVTHDATAATVAGLIEAAEGAGEGFRARVVER